MPSATFNTMLVADFIYVSAEALREGFGARQLPEPAYEIQPDLINVQRLVVEQDLKAGSQWLSIIGAGFLSQHAALIQPGLSESNQHSGNLGKEPFLSQQPLGFEAALDGGYIQTSCAFQSRAQPIIQRPDLIRPG